MDVHRFGARLPVRTGRSTSTPHAREVAHRELCGGLGVRWAASHLRMDQPRLRNVELQVHMRSSAPPPRGTMSVCQLGHNDRHVHGVVARRGSVPAAPLVPPWRPAVQVMAVAPNQHADLRRRAAECRGDRHWQDPDAIRAERRASRTLRLAHAWPHATAEAAVERLTRALAGMGTARHRAHPVLLGRSRRSETPLACGQPALSSVTTMSPPPRAFQALATPVHGRRASK
jgi:hypothetical protein